MIRYEKPLIVEEKMLVRDLVYAEPQGAGGGPVPACSTVVKRIETEDNEVKLT